MKNLKDKIVLITGASSGIGEGCARKFADAQAKLILVARRLDRLKKLADELPTRTYLIKLDVRNQADVEKAINELPDEWADINILINNAGLSRGLEKFHECKISGWDEMIDTNIKGLLYVSRAVTPNMVKRGFGHVINIGSIAGHEIYSGGNVYCATKHAVDAITRGMRIDLSGTGVKVSTVDPGLVETEFSSVRFYGDDKKANSVYKGFSPLTGDDIGETTLWVASRPDHVQIAEVIVLPSAQASATTVYKNS